MIRAALVALLCIAAATVASAALAQGAPGQEELTPSILTPQLIAEADQAHTADQASPEPDAEAAEELPHTDLDQAGALQLMTSVFAEAVEAPAGLLDDVPAGKFIGTNAEILPPEAVAELSEEDGSEQGAAGPAGPALIESAAPLRVEDEAGKLEPVDLSLEHSDGELQAANPIVPVGIPTELGGGIELGEGGIELSFPGAAPGREPTTVEGDSAFYANVQEDTDLLVAPMPEGIETLTQIRSADAPRTQVENLSLPDGATLKATEQGGAEVLQEGRQLMEVTPALAVDAAGEPVPTSLTVSADDLQVTVEPGKGVTYPILVDPNFRLDEYNWTWGSSPFTGWQGGRSAPGYWALEHAGSYRALELSSGYPGGANAGTGAEWVYRVPRFSEDITNYGSAPTSWIEYVGLSGMMYLDDPGNTYYPQIVSGILNSSRTAWTSIWTHNGTEGEITGWSGIHTFSDGGNRDGRIFTFSLSTNEYEAQARLREALAAQVTIELRDEDTPIVKAASLISPPSGWVNTGSFQLEYELEDTGLGVAGLRTEVEGQTATLHTYPLGCSGTNQAPCPRVLKTTTGVLPAIKLNAAEAPTGRDWFQVGAYDPLYGYEEFGHDLAPHVAMKPQAVELKVDHTAPVVSLSGPATEQESLGTTLTEYPLNIAVTDGEDGAPQSGVASVEVKVDGKKVTMPNETPWHPNCAAQTPNQNCGFSGTWTLKSSEYALGSHEVEVIATDAVGLVTSEVQEVELGQEPLQTSFTSPHPTYESHEIPTISFKGTREGKPVEGVTYRCALDEGEAPTKKCATPFHVPADLEAGKWHTLVVAAVDKSGVADPTPARWHFQTGAYPQVPPPTAPSEKLVYPEVGKVTASYYTLEAEWGANPEGKAGQGVTGVTFEMKLPKPSGATVEPVFEPVPTACVIDGKGKQVSWPLPARSHPGHSAPVYLKVRGCPVFEKAGYPEKEIQFRAVFDGGEKVAGASDPAATEYVNNKNATRSSTDATETIGPVSVDLLTGAFTLSRTDVSIPVPGYEANLEFTRTYKSTEDGSLPGYSKVMGGAWQPASPLESEYEGETWTRVEEKLIPAKPVVWGYACWEEKEVGEEEFAEVEVACVNPEVNCPQATCDKWEEEPAQPKEEWIELFDTEGNSVPFEISGNSYIPPEWARELMLTKEGTTFVLGYVNGTRTTFVQDGVEAKDYLPKFISYQANSKSMRMEYATETGGKGLRLVKETAPSPVNCESQPQIHPGCRTLLFNYTEHLYGAPFVLTSISYYGPNGSGVGETVAQYTYGGFGQPGHEEFHLLNEKDPRLPVAPEAYKYLNSPFNNALYGLTPPGQTPWLFSYYQVAGQPRPSLKTVSRASATTTIAYGVPVSGAGAPYAMSPESVANWGQTDFPVDATAIFPPNHVPSESPPNVYTGATIHYMDPDGHQVNVASPSPPGITGASIATTETDVHGDIVRELDPQNRLYALEAPNPLTRSHELDTHSVYNATGTEQLESWGPLHKVRLASGEPAEGRRHSVTRYDEGEPTPAAGTPWAFLPTKETVGLAVPGNEADLEPRVTETRYEWTLRLPEETIVDPSGLHIRSITKYNEAGQVVETRQPKAAAGGTAGDTRTVYYSATGGPECVSEQWANLPCKIFPAAQAEGPGRPKVLVKSFTKYSNLDEPESVTESAGGEGQTRVTTMTYDGAGRPVTTKITGGASTTTLELPATKTVYSTTSGLPVEQAFVCEPPTNCTGFDSQATTLTYDSQGRVERYVDADGNEAKTTYDAYGRPVTTSDGKGSKTVTYDPESGLPTKLEVSGVGTFTGRYDADGDLVETTLPNGITKKTTYNAAGEAMTLAYTKASICRESSSTCFEEALERGADGRIATDTNTLASDRYIYDNAGRLKESFETPVGGGCTTRRYTHDADSNRLKKTTVEPGIGGICSTAEGTTERYEYDTADRLMGSGVTYDNWGRTTNLPGAYAGGSTLETKYFATNMVAEQTQASVHNSFQVDASGRQRQREQNGGVAGTEIFHYDGPSDSPSWTALGATWSRNVTGLGGELVAVQESSGTTTFKLTNLHGDVVASASSSPTVTELLATFRSDEFGVPQAGTAGRFGWVGGKQRRTELGSGVIQMGARSYVPSLGRFLTPDPVPGGAANPYDYANQDPVNGFDLDGNCSSKKKCRALAKRARAKVQRQVRSIHAEMRTLRTREQTRVSRTFIAGVPITVPLENIVNEALSEIQNSIGDVVGKSCTEQAETFGIASGAAVVGRHAALKAGWRTIAGRLSDLSEVGAIVGLALGAAGKLGFC